jgi:thymidylate kinase
VIVAIEGIDGSGKDVQAAALPKALLAAGYGAVEVAHFPNYESITGKVIQGLLKGLWGHARMPEGPWQTISTPEYEARQEQEQTLDALTLQALMVTNRFEQYGYLSKFEHDTHPHARKVEKKVLIVKRYNASAYAYGLADGLPREWLVKVHEALPQPQHWFLLDVSVEESLRRRPKRTDLYEADVVRLKKAREHYLELFAPDKRGYRDGGSSQWHVLDGTRTPEEITAEIARIIG